MPPPPSPPSGGSGQRSISLNDKPATPTFSTTSNDTAVEDDGMESLASIQNNSKALQDKIQSMLSGKPARAESPKRRSSTTTLQEDSLFSPKSAATHRVEQERLENFERENSQLKAELNQARLAVSKVAELEAAGSERDRALDRVKELESSLKASERTIDERNTKIESLERSVQSSNAALQTLKAEEDARVKDLQTKLGDSETLIASLKEAIEAKANEAGQNEGLIQAKDAEIALLEGRVKKATSDLEESRKELTALIDELRHAGQETIALYEERLAAADARRYQLEDELDKLEEQLKRRGSLSRSVSGTYDSAEATRIDNEALQEQVQHLQGRISTLEDMLEDARSSLEREEAITRNRIQRHKENEAALRNEMAETRRDIELLAKSESIARAKAAEAEEALRENTITLENAQAEIESLRVEIAVSHSPEISFLLLLGHVLMFRPSRSRMSLALHPNDRETMNPLVSWLSSVNAIARKYRNSRIFLKRLAAHGRKPYKTWIVPDRMHSALRALCQVSSRLSRASMPRKLRCVILISRRNNSCTDVAS